MATKTASNALLSQAFQSAGPDEVIIAPLDADNKARIELRTILSNLGTAKSPQEIEQVTGLVEASVKLLSRYYSHSDQAVPLISELTNEKALDTTVKILRGNPVPLDVAMLNSLIEILRKFMRTSVDTLLEGHKSVTKRYLAGFLSLNYALDAKLAYSEIDEMLKDSYLRVAGRSPVGPVLTRS